MAISSPAISAKTTGAKVVRAKPVVVRKTALAADGLKTESLVNPLGLDARQPRLSWQLKAQRRGTRQGAYQILVSSTHGNLMRGRGDLWNSGKVLTEQSNHVLYRGKALPSGARAYWKVRVWDSAGRLSMY
ncbi:MAG: alpha-L-rhamnosidase, partial [Abditibacteriota bacterium]|nr:alpha-L-rhamnosidase [Abditibacteriota bacterium]